MYDITAVLNLHHEGLAALASLRSLDDAARQAEDKGTRVERLVVADRPDAATLDILDFAHHAGFRSVRVDFGDLGQARNAAVREAAGDHIAFLDGDDLWSANWLDAAHTAAVADGRMTAWHPECSVYFGSEVTSRISRHPDMTEDVYVWSRLAIENMWTALVFAPRELLASLQYQPTLLRSGQGYEDWTWNISVVEAGGYHRIVPGTVHLIRSNPHSLVRNTAQAGALPVPGHLFRKRLIEPPGALGLI